MVVHGRVVYDVAHKAMIDADILINLSNDDKYQVPGKIMEYFSLGKAIVNFKFREDDAGNCEYEKYPLIYNVNLSLENDKGNLINILNSFVGRYVSVKKLDELYFDSKPDYFVSLLEETSQWYSIVWREKVYVKKVITKI